MLAWSPKTEAFSHGGKGRLRVGEPCATYLRMPSGVAAADDAWRRVADGAAGAAKGAETGQGGQLKYLAVTFPWPIYDDVTPPGPLEMALPLWLNTELDMGFATAPGRKFCERRVSGDDASGSRRERSRPGSSWRTSPLPTTLKVGFPDAVETGDRDLRVVRDCSSVEDGVRLSGWSMRSGWWWCNEEAPSTFRAFTARCLPKGDSHAEIGRGLAASCGRCRRWAVESRG